MCFIAVTQLPACQILFLRIKSPHKTILYNVNLRDVNMAGSVNKVILIGNLGADPEIRSTQDGKEIGNLRVATTESWRDKNSGERRDKTEWHRVVIFSPGLVTIAKQYLKKGSKVYIEGALQTRKWQDQSGAEKFSTEIVLQGFNSTLTMLDGRNGPGESGGYSGNDSGSNYSSGNQSQGSSSSSSEEFAVEELDDEIPF